MFDAMIAPSPPLPSLPSKLSIGSEIIHDLSPLLHSLFFETEINFGGEGGVYAELLPNRDLETLGRGRVAEASKTVPGRSHTSAVITPRSHFHRKSSDSTGQPR